MVTAQQLFDRIDDIAPVLRAGGREAERSGRLSQASIDALHSSGLFRFWWPAELGGAAASLSQGIATVERLAAVDTTAAWVVAVGSAHAGFVGAYLADHAIEEIFAGDEPVIAGQMAPMGQARRVDGGLRVTGAWSFGSGIRHANWVLGGATVTDDSGVPLEAVVVVAPIGAAIVDENSWQVAGLAGTGSCDYRLTDHFVPEGWWFAFPLAQRLRGAQVYDLPTPVQAVILHGGFVLGTARRSLDEIVALAAAKTRHRAVAPLGQHPTFQRDLAECQAKVAAARLYVHDAARRLDAAGDLDRSTVALETRAAGRYATDVAVEVTTWAYRCGGGTSLRLDHPLQQLLRDTFGATQHVFVDDAAYVNYGAALVQRAIAATRPDG